MATFKKRSTNTFKKKVSVFLGDESLGDLDVTFVQLSQDEFSDLVENENDAGLCKRVIQAVGDIPVDGSEGEVIKGQDAIDLVLNDASCVSACAVEYMETLKSGNFRKRGARGRR